VTLAVAASVLLTVAPGGGTWLRWMADHGARRDG
jgi:hypothetical protein